MDDSTRIRNDRLPAIDIARGLALLAMMSYHLSWDLAYHNFVDWQVTAAPAWRAYAISIAAAFLTLSGISLVLATRGGLDGAAYARRIAKIALAAALVSLVTYLAFPESWVFFGVLHMIALGGVLALPFLRSPVLLTAVAAVIAFALPHYVRGGVFNAPLLAFLGLASVPPIANDFVPVFPWLAAILAGLLLGRAIASGLLPLRTDPPQTSPGRFLALLGRWSLVIYLVHQPLLFGLVALAAAILPANPVVERTNFVADCEAACTQDAEVCTRFCGCVAASLEGTSYFTVRGGDPDMSAAVSTAVSACSAPEATGD